MNNMATLAKNKIILAAVAIFILAMFLYNLFLSPEAISFPSEVPAASIGDDLIKIHDELQQVTLDKSIFSAKGYLELTDFSTAIPPYTPGRSNPFDIIGRD